MALAVALQKPLAVRCCCVKVDVVMMLKFLIVGLLLIFTCIKGAAIGKALDASFGRKIFIFRLGKLDKANLPQLSEKFYETTVGLNLQRPGLR